MTAVPSISPASIAVRLVLATLLIVGVVGSAFGSLGCYAGACQSHCPMHQAEAKPKSCCPESADGEGIAAKPSPTECDCAFTSWPETAKVDAAAPTVNPQIALAPAPALETPQPAPGPVVELCIHFRGDLPPPIVARHPDLGRAPPAA